MAFFLPISYPVLVLPFSSSFSSIIHSFSSFSSSFRILHHRPSLTPPSPPSFFFSRRVQNVFFFFFFFFIFFLESLATK